ncbi:MAG: HAMP domain-containing protein [Gammaproteobacteria bacterium]|nr:HAMP domain-containing protein [Gammaproteobacteria bacterium]MBV9621123.1 HAMP domain-containing protein [Gammaproteobacteria bacterium]
MIAVLLAHAGALMLIAQEREHFVLAGSVREWTRLITEMTLALRPLDPPQRTAMIAQLTDTPHALHPHLLGLSPGAVHEAPPDATRIVPVPLFGDFPGTLRQQLRRALGPQFEVEVTPTPQPPPAAILIPHPFYELHELAAHRSALRRYDVTVRLPEGDTLRYRIIRMPAGAPLPRNLVLNLALLLLILVIVLYAVARSVTRPLSALAHAADQLGEGHPAPLPEVGARELRHAARAFNAMQDRLRRYLDSRTRVLAAMSHDLKTPLTRLRLQVETLDGQDSLQQRMGQQLDEMEGMVHEALALFRGLDDREPAVPVDLAALLGQIAAEFRDLGEVVSLAGSAAPLPARAQALKRCLRNLISNALNFGGGAEVQLADGPEVCVRVLDHGPGIPPAELERVFEPFYRLESSRNRAGGGTGLGLSIARDVAQAHGGSLTLHNRPQGGLEARLCLPR